MRPQQFLADFVLPAVAEWRDDPLNVRRAVIAACELDNLTEHYLQTVNPLISRDALRVERDRLAVVRPELGIVRDIHDTHKHGHLSRRTAIIRTGMRVRIVYVDGVWEDSVFEEGVFHKSEDVLEILLDDGTSKHFRDVLGRSLAHWRAAVRTLGP